MTERHDSTTKKEPADLPSDLLHDSGEAGGDPDAHLGVTEDHLPRAEDDGPATTKLQRTAGQETENDEVVAEQDSTGVAPS